MNIFETPYFRNNKRFIILLGQWPFLSSIQKYCARCVVFILIISILMPKLIKLIEVLDDVDGIIECVPMIGFHIGSLTKFFNWIVNSKKMKHLLVRMQRDWNNLEFSRDIDIMHEFYERGRILTMAYASMSNYQHINSNNCSLLESLHICRAATLFTILGFYLASPSIPKILDILYPLNESRSRIYLYQTEYFVDQDEYYITILIHAYMTVPVSISVLIFVDNMFAMYIHHACGLFAALRLHLESIHININNTGDGDCEFKESERIYRQIVMCVNMHKNVIEFCNELESSGNISYLIILITNLSMITVTGIVTVMKIDQPSESMRFFAFTIGAVSHIFFSCFMGQKLIEESGLIFHAAYTFEWYTIPTNLQSLIIPIMVRSLNPCQLTAGKVITLSMNTFSLVLKNAMSLFTVVSSMR